MLNSLLVDEEKGRGNKNFVLKKDVERTIDRARKRKKKSLKKEKKSLKMEKKRKKKERAFYYFLA